MCVTNKRKNNLFGYLVAAGGFLMVMLTMSLLISKTLLLDWMVLVLVAAGIFLVALGMYVVHPKETKEYLDTAGEAIDHLPVRFNRRSEDRAHPAPAVVTPASDQAVIVRPATEPEESELATEEAAQQQIAPLAGRRNPYHHGDG
jgi:hypothetical protein